METAWLGSTAVLHTGLARITDESGRILLLLTGTDVKWCLPGGICIPGEPPIDAAAYQIRRTMRIDVAPQRVVGYAPGAADRHPVAQGPPGDAYLMECNPLSPSQIKRITLPEAPPRERPEFLKVAFWDPFNLPPGMRPRDLRLLGREARVEPPVPIPHLSRREFFRLTG
ncbi:hypothetical protein [Streptomyces syringium]|uniref:NUDIX domain-containing protein n=1 Tax=Streptomyces syringium TaxID=76729 RepID=A0ABS4Y6Q7_9ACTN|nr:hypothetical protein [Streptomyces syringium]MBP2404463.1 hypothetical protein [Streptomyces syringium]